MQVTRHNSNQARYLYGTPTGILEFRAFHTRTTIINTLITHQPACDGDQCAEHGCDADNGDDIAMNWLTGDDTGIWYALAEYALADEMADIPQTSGEPSHEQRDFRGRLIAEGQWIATDPYLRD